MKSDFLQQLDHDNIVKTIQLAEQCTTGEIRVRVSHQKVLLFGDEMQAARRAFKSMEMSKTPDRNGVLLMIFPKRRQVVILGDRAIHEKVGQTFWENVIQTATNEFKDKHYTEGIVRAVEIVGKALSQYFPKTRSDSDSLPNKVIED
jgi:uncharacterized membrane protein